MFKLITGIVGLSKDGSQKPLMQIVDHRVVSQDCRLETWVLAHKDGKLYHAITKGVVSRHELNRTDPSTWTDRENNLPPEQVDPAHFYPKYKPQYTRIWDVEGCTVKGYYKKHNTILEAGHRRIRDVRYPDFTAETTAREVEICEKLRMHPHKHICKYHGVQMSRALQFEYRGSPIQVPMHDERVLKLVFDKYDCDLWEAIQHDCAVNIRHCLEAVATATWHMHGLGIVHGDIKPHNIFIKYPKGPYDPTPVRYAVGDFDSAQLTGSVVDGKHGSPYWSLEKKVWVDTVEEDDDWFSFEKLRKWLVRIKVGRLEDYEGIGKKWKSSHRATSGE